MHIRSYTFRIMTYDIHRKMSAAKDVHCAQLECNSTQERVSDPRTRTHSGIGFTSLCCGLLLHMHTYIHCPVFLSRQGLRQVSPGPPCPREADRISKQVPSDPSPLHSARPPPPTHTCWPLLIVYLFCRVQVAASQSD